MVSLRVSLRIGILKDTLRICIIGMVSAVHLVGNVYSTTRWRGGTAHTIPLAVYRGSCRTCYVTPQTRVVFAQYYIIPQPWGTCNAIVNASTQTNKMDKKVRYVRTNNNEHRLLLRTCTGPSSRGRRGTSHGHQLLLPFASAACVAGAPIDPALEPLSKVTRTHHTGAARRCLLLIFLTNPSDCARATGRRCARPMRARTTRPASGRRNDQHRGAIEPCES